MAGRALDTLDTARQDDATKRHAVELALEKARYEARRAQRQFDAVDPENRLVAGELEHRWNQALDEVADLAARVAALRETAGPLSEAQRERVLALGTDLRGLWQHPAAPVDLKKHILRTVLEEIVVNHTDDSPQHVLQLHWKGGVQRPTVQARIQAVHQGHKLPRTIPGQDELPLKSDSL